MVARTKENRGQALVEWLSLLTVGMMAWGLFWQFGIDTMQKTLSSSLAVLQARIRLSTPLRKGTNFNPDRSATVCWGPQCYSYSIENPKLRLSFQK